ncbi:LamG-like jellyroll fold domain-containing protein [Spirilliplanes yamanashiensis]|uniref:Calcineurin-like phosphoesterase domain-containing protein n=1 Tax=Spirilliplanes yamanashiensis TaxID=42233 RepID=A0A8J3Y9Y8_9ACTN|nr:LamG-like jellyroll fold domain-containing protein [Spirilliplanes yamanashiensis]MDP9815669.1 hypothetical protein [Spirilliplanes yamanashiensis]GIJ03923.1 hypothetical protein Sya03_32750 [Spirilliplanes yamanashiensis]
MDLRRRSLLGAALVAPVAATAAAPAAPAAAGPARFDRRADRFALAVLPDTQYLFDADSADPAPLRATLRWLTAHRADANVAFLTHLGDITEHGTAAEIALADAAFRAVDGRLPYSVLAGNHDVPGSTDDQRGDSPYLRAFGPHRFAGAGTFGGASPDGYNSYHVVPAAGREWLVLALDWRASDSGLAWAQGVLDAHPTLPAILTTHDLAAADATGAARLSAHGKRLWDRLVRRNDQIFLTLNGHWWPPGRAVLTNDAGNDVHVHVTNYQDRYYGGAAMLRLYRFDLARGVIDVETFAPYLAGRAEPLAAETRELTSDVDRFSLAIDFDARFAGFAPVPAPPPRPPAAVMPRGTVAYWRFDDAGFDGTTARDLTGRGNDLTVTLLHGSPRAALTRSADHHPGAPAHASIRLDGGKAPDRGAVLRTGPAAPLNAATLRDGYTIEVFLKLPDPFAGDHAWMGVLSWEGRSGDAGKTTGWSPDEPTCSLNVSPERFLQYVVYPADTDADPTSWSHAVPVGRWLHVAVVNDARRTVMYVDGSPIARNPAQPARGIATLGRPFALGGTQFAGRYGQGFHGFLGDVRIVSRALTPREFLTPHR